jgi:hypothetical protein
MSYYSKNQDGKVRSCGEAIGPFTAPSKYVNTEKVPICRGAHDWRAKEVLGTRILEKCARCPEFQLVPYIGS